MKSIYIAAAEVLKKVIPQKFYHLFRPLKLRFMPSNYRRLTCVWFITWVCNLRCPYCWQLEAPGIYRKKYSFTVKEWLRAWEKISPHFDEIVVGITGGEPFLQEGFISMFNALPLNVKYEITSNLSFDIAKFLSSPDIRRNCLGVVCSFHPAASSGQGNYMEDFFTKVKKLKILRYTRVNFVAAPTNLKFYDQVRNFCNENNIGLHVDRYVSLGKGMQFTAEESEFAEKIIAADRKQSLGEKRAVLCNGGNEHIALLPDGSMYPCLKKAELREDLVGNVFSAGVHLNDQWLQCSYYPSCRGCDWDNISVKVS